MTIIARNIKDFAPLLGKPGSGDTKPAKVARPRTRTPKELLPENQVEAQVVGWMEAHGFIAVKQHAGKLRKGASVFTFGKKGELDWRFSRPLYPGAKPARPECEVVSLEVKAPGKLPSNAQLTRIQELVAQGFVAGWVSSLAELEIFYARHFGKRAA